MIVAGLWLFPPSTDWFPLNPISFVKIFSTGVLVIVAFGLWEFSQFIFKNNSPIESAPKNKTLADIILIGERAIYVLGGIICYRAVGNVPDMLSWARPALLFRNASNGELFWFIGGFIWWILASILVILYPRSQAVLSFKVFRGLAGYFTMVPFALALEWLRYINLIDNPYVGAKILISVMILVWCADSGAYFTGRLLGKHHMSPHVSPNKTWEGLVGGVVLAMVAFFILEHFGWYSLHYANFPVLIVTAFLTIIISIFGDLTESMFKRYAGIKDSGIIFPGHGGMIDRVDSLSAAVPFFLVCYAILSLLFK